MRRIVSPRIEPFLQYIANSGEDDLIIKILAMLIPHDAFALACSNKFFQEWFSNNSIYWQAKLISHFGEKYPELYKLQDKSYKTFLAIEKQIYHWHRLRARKLISYIKEKNYTDFFNLNSSREELTQGYNQSQILDFYIEQCFR